MSRVCSQCLNLDLKHSYLLAHPSKVVQAHLASAKSLQEERLEVKFESD